MGEGRKEDLFLNVKRLSTGKVWVVRMVVIYIWLFRSSGGGREKTFFLGRLFFVAGFFVTTNIFYAKCRRRSREEQTANRLYGKVFFCVRIFGLTNKCGIVFSVCILVVSSCGLQTSLRYTR